MIRYVLTARPRDDSVRFIFYGDPVPILHLQKEVKTYSVICTPQGGYPLCDSYGADPIELGGQLINCYTFGFIEPPDPAAPLTLEMHLRLQDKSNGALITDDVFSLTFARHLPGQTLAMDVNEWVADVFIRRIALHISPLDLSFTIYHDDPGPDPIRSAYLFMMFDEHSPQHSIGAMLPSPDGLAFLLAPWPEEATHADRTARYDTLVLWTPRDEKAMLLDFSTGSAQWMGFHDLPAEAQRSFRVNVTPRELDEW